MSINVYASGLIAAMKPYRRRLVLGIAATAVSAAFEVSSPLLMKYGVDSLNAGRKVGWLYAISGMIVLAAAIGGLFRYWMRDIVIGVSRFIESDLRGKFFSRLLRLAPAFFDNNHTGNLMARATDDVDRLRMVVGPALLYAVNTALVLAFSAAMMLALNLQLAALVLLIAPLVGVTVLIVAKSLHDANRRQQDVYSELTAKVQENLTGIRVIKAFVREEHEEGQFREVCSRYLTRSLVVARIQALFMPVLSLLIGIGVAGIFWLGGMQVASGLLSLGDFIAFLGYLSLMTWPMIAIGWVTHLYQRGSASFERLAEIQAEEEQFSGDSYHSHSDTGKIHPTDISHYRDGEGGKMEAGSKAPEVVFRDIRFRYRAGDPWVLDGFDLIVPAGGTLAIVGRVGVGKSTILRLLARLYEPESGEILLGGTRWDALPARFLRAMIGYIDQSSFLFSARIRDNITFGDESASLEQIERAAYTACLGEDVAGFPQGYDTVIGERGVKLSGGQQQRLTLARALMVEPKILLLDDALSAVDADTEAEILTRLLDRTRDVTTLFVTHRLAAAERADAIAVVERGRVTEHGSHEKLMNLDGVYAAMFRRQRLAEEIGVWDE